MNTLSKYSIVWSTAGLLSCLAVHTTAQYRVLHHFTGGANDGGWMALSTFIRSDSVFYGMTAKGGNHNNGIIFRMNRDGTDFRLLYSFVSPADDGTRPYGSLLLDDSSLYGMAGSEKSSNSGTFFKIDTNGANYHVLHRFSGSEGKWPYDTPIMSDSVFYGFTTYGGCDTSSGWNGGGTIFRMNKGGSGFQLLHIFQNNSNDGFGPHGSLIRIGPALYGTTLVGGYGAGTIFKIDTNGKGFELLHKFTAAADDGSVPYGTTLVLSGSTLYGMTREGGSGGNGTIFRMNIDGSGFGLLHSFKGGINDGLKPECGTLVLSGTTLYGMTTGGGAGNCGSIFAINIDGTGFRLLHSFGGGDGKAPLGSLFLSDSTLYGMTPQGGSNNNGVIFALDLRQPTDVHTEEGLGILKNFRLEQNYPNPFNPSTVIRYRLSVSGDAKLTIYDLLGRKIKTLVDSYQSAAEHTVVWDATDENDMPVGSGMYFYRLETGSRFLQRKMVLTR